MSLQEWLEQGLRLSPRRGGLLLALAVLGLTLACRALLALLAPGAWSPLLHGPALLLAPLFGGLAGGLLALLAWGADALSTAAPSALPLLASLPPALVLAGAGLLLGEWARKILTREATGQRQAEDELATARQRQEMLRHELTHRVKNNFQLVGSLLRLQARRAGNEAASRILNTTVLRIQGMSALHESLYRSRDIGRVELSHYLREVCGRVAESQALGRGIRVSVEAEAAELPGEYALPLGLAVSELVSNALRHAYAPDGQGEVRVSLRREGEDFLLTVSDDGKGLEDPATVLQRGFGMLLVGSCAQQMEGELTVAEHPTRFEIRFPATLSA